ncbi:MAG: RraA family protein [Acidimicrobiales bacterium]|jgi:regulator of RNase E activity RraA
MTVASNELRQELASFSTPSIANGIETFGVRPRHEGFMNGSIRCQFPRLGPVVGHAATARIRAGAKDEGDSLHASELWRHVMSVPEPRIVVVEDLDDPSGVGSFWGEVNANVFRALGCAAVVTNGGVRDLPEMEALGFQAFASSICVSHAYVRVVAVALPVTVGGLQVRAGDLLHGDRHGVVSIPHSIASELPAAVRAIEVAERELIAFCQSPQFSLEGLPARWRST